MINLLYSRQVRQVAGLLTLFHAFRQKGQFFMDRSKLIKMLVMLSMIVVIVGSLTRLVRSNSISLEEYAQQHPSSGTESSESV